VNTLFAQIDGALGNWTTGQTNGDT